MKDGLMVDKWMLLAVVGLLVVGVTMDLEFVSDKNQIAAQLAAKLNPSDIVLTLGAGDIYKVGEALIEALK